VDDEVESLTSHIMFLEEQGFRVEPAANGDDALVLLQRQPYGVVLLDEQMPGRRGLELFHAIRAIDGAMPVVMVTKSEEPETLRDAIGAELSDYLVKPVNPRQIVSVVTRLLEGDRIRQQRLSRDFTTRFRELESRRGTALAWREWVELVAELAEWEVKLARADEPGLQEALRTLQDSLRQDFARFLEEHYAHWLHGGEEDRPPLSVDVGAEFLAARVSILRLPTISPYCPPRRPTPGTPSSAVSSRASLRLVTRNGGGSRMMSASMPMRRNFSRNTSPPCSRNPFRCAMRRYSPPLTARVSCAGFPRTWRRMGLRLWCSILWTNSRTGARRIRRSSRWLATLVRCAN
jgi:CheY-like chemotaxis protein